jgi:CRISPR-associated protein Csm2
MPDYGRRHEQSQRGRQGAEQRENPVSVIRQKLENYKSTGLKNLSADELVNIADRMGKYLESLDLKTTQVRRFLDGVRKIDALSEKGKNFSKDLVILLKPKLAYAAGRDKEKIGPLMQVLEPAITAGSRTYEDFKRLIALIEGIMAYHKYYGGRDS